MILPQLKIMFLDIPKTGTSSIKRFLYKSFEKNFDIIGATTPLWLNRFCPEYVLPQLKEGGKSIHVTSNRHEPLVSRYNNINYIHDYFIFTIIRNPFTRFKSAFMEFMIDIFYGADSLLSIDHGCVFENRNHIPDTWYITKSMMGTSSTELVLKAQSELIFNKLKIIHAKGGFERNNACHTSLHFWPQYYFTNLVTPKPINILFLNFEDLQNEFTYLKEEMSRFSGVDVTKYELTHVNPLSQQIFSLLNPQAVNTIDSEVSNSALELFSKIKPDNKFIDKYPTYQDFLPDFNKQVKELENQFLPAIEEHRWLIEQLYAEDYRRFGYAQQSLKDTPIS